MTEAERIAAGLSENTYLKPAHGWTCFHCGETFTTIGSARDHFGFDPSAEPACRIKVGAERGLVMALRKAEKELAEAWGAIHSEGTEAAKAYYAQMTRHRAQIIAVEEAAYERGLEDGRKVLETDNAQHGSNTTKAKQRACANALGDFLSWLRETAK